MWVARDHLEALVPKHKIKEPTWVVCSSSGGAVSLSTDTLNSWMHVILTFELESILLLVHHLTLLDFHIWQQVYITKMDLCPCCLCGCQSVLQLFPIRAELPVGCRFATLKLSRLCALTL